MPAKDFAVFDSDSHVVEPPALWDKFLGKHRNKRDLGVCCE